MLGTFQSQFFWKKHYDSLVPPKFEYWYWADEKQDLAATTALVSHEFANGKGVIRSNQTICQAWLQRSRIKAFSMNDYTVGAGTYALAQCIDLENVVHISKKINGNMNSFVRDCNSLKKIRLPRILTVLADNILTGCISLGSIDLPPRITSLGINSLAQCTSLKRVDIPDTVTSIGSGCFSGSSLLEVVKLPEGIRTVSATAFLGTKITEFSYPNSVMAIGQQTFQYSAIKKVHFPDVFNSWIGSWCQYAYQLEEANFPQGITEIRVSAFQNCYRVRFQGEIPETVVGKIGDNAFNACRLVSFTRLPSGVTEVGNNAFQTCYNLALTELPSGLMAIGQSSFESCYSMSLTSLPSSLESIGSYAFQYCRNIKITEIPASVKTIALASFAYCYSLRTIRFLGKPTTIDSQAFRYDTWITDIYVPWSQGEVAGAPWGATNAVVHYNAT